MRGKHYIFKRIFGFGIVVTLLLSVTACGSSTDDAVRSDVGEQASEEQPVEEETSEAQTESETIQESMFASDEEIAEESETEQAEDGQEEAGLSSGLTAVQDDLKSSRYNGFLTEEFTKPEDIDWKAVFYVGAGLYDDGKFADVRKDIEQAYADGSEEKEYDISEYGLDIFDGQVIRDFIEGTTGLSYEEMNKPLGLQYLEKWDVYATISTGDTNAVDVSIKSGEKDSDGVYTIEYDNDGKPFKARLKENGDYWQFLSNEWNPEGGKEAAVHDMYSEIISKYRDAVTQGWKEDKLKEEKVSAMCVHYTGDDEALEKLGYYLYDIDGDGTEELFIGRKGTPGYKCDIYKVYYVRMGRFSDNVDIDGTERTMYYLADDDTLYEDFSGSARDGVLAHYNVLASGEVEMLTPIDRIIFNEDEEGGEEHPWYYGKGYGYVMERMSRSEFQSYSDKAEASYKYLDYTSLSEWE